MPVIDLDSPRPVAVRRAPRRRPFLLVLAGAMLLPVTGEPAGPMEPVDAASVCADLPPIAGREGEPVNLAVIDPRSGEITLQITCPAPASVTVR